MNSIIRGFTKLIDFKGRDRRSQFWPFAGVVLAVQFVLAIVVAVPAFIAQFNTMLAFAEANPDKATVYREGGSVSIQIHDTTGMPPIDLSGLIVPMAALVALLVLLLAAAVTRRLHDRGLSGLWGLIPVSLLCVGVYLWAKVMSLMLGDGGQDGAAFLLPFLLCFLTILAYQASLLVLVVVLALKGKTGPNRYGPEPV